MKKVTPVLLIMLLLPTVYGQDIIEGTEPKISFLVFDYGGKELANYTTDINPESYGRIALKSFYPNTLVLQADDQYISFNVTAIVNGGNTEANLTVDEMPETMFNTTGVFETQGSTSKYAVYEERDVTTGDVEFTIDAQTYIDLVIKPKYPDYEDSEYNGVRKFYYDGETKVYNRVSVLRFDLLVASSYTYIFETTVENYKIFDKTKEGEGTTYSDDISDTLVVFNARLNEFTHFFEYPFDSQAGTFLVNDLLQLFLIDDKMSVYDITSGTLRTVDYKKNFDLLDRTTRLIRVETVRQGIAMSTRRNTLDKPVNYLVGNDGQGRKIELEKDFDYPPIFLNDYVVYSVGVKQEGLLSALQGQPIQRIGYTIALVITLVLVAAAYVLRHRKRKRLSFVEEE